MLAPRKRVTVLRARVAVALKALPHSSLFALATTVAIACASAQTTHVVGPGGFSQVATALANAAPGDVIVVHPGTYSGFTATIGVTIRAVTNGTVTISGGCAVGCPPPQTVHLVDLDFAGLTVQSGVCSLDRCRVFPFGGPALVAFNARVCLQDCVVGYSGATAWPTNVSGLVATAATISAIDTTFRGPGSHWLGFPGSPGVILTNRTLHGSGITIDGGDGYMMTPGALPPEIGLSASASSVVWLSDSTVRGGRALDLPGTPHVACPMRNWTPSGVLSRCTHDPTTCPPAIATNGAGTGVHRAGPWRSGTSFTLTTHCAPNAFVGVFASPDLETGAILALPQPVLLGLATVNAVALMQADGVGLASISWTLPAGTADLRMWLQAAAAGTGPLQLSPVAGGVVRP